MSKPKKSSAPKKPKAPKKEKVAKPQKAKKPKPVVVKEPKHRKGEDVPSLPAIDPSLPKEKQEALAAKRIANAAQAVERIEGELSKSRHEWAELVAKRKVSLKASIENTNGGAHEQLVRIRSAHTKHEEAEAGRKVALADVLEKKKRARKVLADAFATAQQMEIDFADHPKHRKMNDDEEDTVKAVEQMAEQDDAERE